MNGAHLHLVVNHLPIVGVIIGTLVLIGGYLLKKEQVKLTALGIYVFTAITAMIANFTGEGAEEIAEKIPGVTDALIHNHEENAETFLALCIALGVVSLITFFLATKKHIFAKIGMIACLVLGLAGIFTGKTAGTTGGEIRHTEIRTGYAASDSNAIPEEAQSMDDDEDGE
jgi:uncharacterized membrane protein